VLSSSVGSLAGEALGALAQAVQREITRRGAIRITKESGLFLCSKSS
jgi:hypothetical protein